MLPLAINDVLRVEGKLVRVIAAAPSEDRAFLFELPEEPLKHSRASWRRDPFVRPLSWLITAAESHPDVYLAPPFVPRPTDLKVMEGRFARIKDLVDKPEILFNDTRWQLLCSHALTVGVRPKTLLHDLRLWWIGGQVKQALLGCYFRSGRLSAATKHVQTFIEHGERGPLTILMVGTEGRKAPGRRPKDGSYEPYLMTDQERKDVLQVAKQCYLEDASRTLSDVVRVVHLTLYHNKVSPVAGAVQLLGRSNLPRGRVPSPRQIIYLLHIVVPKSRAHIRRFGLADFVNNFAPKLGSTHDDAIGPGDVYEIDDTLLDYWIVSTFDPRAILGKPTLHLVVDRGTWLIVGFHLSLDPPSFEDNKLAILSICNDWKVLCEKYGVLYLPESWPAERVLPNRIFADRAGLMTFASDGLERIEVETTNPPPQFSSSKAVVEGTFSRLLSHLRLMPGHEPARNVHQRRRKKYEKNACITLDKLYAAMLQIICTLNRQALSEQQQPLSYTKSGSLATPSQLWSRDIGTRHALPRRVSAEWMRHQMLEVGLATVTRNGIAFQEGLYASEQLRALDWFSIASLGRRFEVAVRYFPKNLDEILVEDPHDPTVRYTACLTSRTPEATGMGVAQRAELAEDRRELRRAAAQHNLEVRVDSLSRMEDLYAADYATMKQATEGMALAARLNAGQALREEEAKARRRSDFALGGIDGADVPPPAAPSAKPDAPEKPQDGTTTPSDLQEGDGDAIRRFFDDRGNGR